MSQPDRDADARAVRAAADRTELAIGRSGLAALVCLALIARRLFTLLDHRHERLLVAGVAAAAVSGTACVVLGARLHRRPDEPDYSPATVARLRAVVVGLLLVAAAALALAFPAA